MDFSIILIIIGILCMIISFFIKDTSKKIEKDVEELSISIYQETNALKRRLKVVEEELLLDPSFQVKSPSNSKQMLDRKTNDLLISSVKNNSVKKTKPVNEILVRQVIELNKQGYAISEISKLSTLSEVQILEILNSHGGNK
ncbi:hypothetical protein [Ureibacillus acetophenoni]|uniref:Uncharacterized protein n=1 Tax=Ureibacillus acetophenoni TaxID=614649 RepID=A0A285U318_9BACL|nr:hypothetical protein [Ureibacillus acetophenoni]SOC36232.1 hypothetical protein SAMN05877842_102168 [Ureibacillus acetophenoni]